MHILYLYMHTFFSLGYGNFRDLWLLVYPDHLCVSGDHLFTPNVFLSCNAKPILLWVVDVFYQCRRSPACFCNVPWVFISTVLYVYDSLYQWFPVVGYCFCSVRIHKYYDTVFQLIVLCWAVIYIYTYVYISHKSRRGDKLFWFDYDIFEQCFRFNTF